MTKGEFLADSHKDLNDKIKVSLCYFLHRDNMRSFNKVLIERICAELDEEKSFLELLARLRRENIINSHRTLRKYLELLVASGLAEEKVIPQRNINPKKLYRVTGRKPRGPSWPLSFFSLRFKQGGST